MIWENKKFIDFIQLQRGHDLTKEHFVLGPYPVVSSTSIMGYHKEYKAETPGVVIGRSGTLGKVQYINENYWPHNTALFVKDFKGNHPRFVYYFLTEFSTDRHGGGSAVPTLNRNSLSGISIKVPDIESQIRIADVLSTYDDLIENNQKQIKLLEESAMLLYKEWFVKLRFPGFESVTIVDGVPEGWEVGRADSFFDISIGKTPPRAESQWFVSNGKGIPWISISDMGKNGVFIYETSENLTKAAVSKHNVNIVPKDTVILSFKLTVGRVAITNTDVTTNEAIAHFKTKKLSLREYIYLYLRNFRYETLGSTSSISIAINSKIVKSIPVTIPSSYVLDAFTTVAKPIFDKINSLQDMTIAAIHARDKLLPKLMCGEIEV